MVVETQGVGTTSRLGSRVRTKEWKDEDEDENKNGEEQDEVAVEGKEGSV